MNLGMSACIVLRTEWLPTLRRFHLASDTAAASPRSQAGVIVDHCSRGWYVRWFQVYNTDS
eukprot:1153359-Pelagomonas_calceolata.AAC.1